MKYRRFFSAATVAALALMLMACGKTESALAKGKQAVPAAAVSAPPAAALSGLAAYEATASRAKGFTTGPIMGANPVYVLFDPQCPHCGHLWSSAQALQGKVKFVWVPVAIMSDKSAPQGVAIMTAANPPEAMNVHEKSLLGREGGIAAAVMTPEQKAVIEANTKLLDELGAQSVPFIVAKNQKTGAVAIKSGALETPALAALLGVTLN